MIFPEITVFRTVCWVIQVATIFYILYLKRTIDKTFKAVQEKEKEQKRLEFENKNPLWKEKMFLECGFYDEEQGFLGEEQEILVCVLNVSSNVFTYAGNRWPAVELFDITNNRTLFCVSNNGGEQKFDRFCFGDIYEVRTSKEKDDSDLCLYIKRIFE